MTSLSARFIQNNTSRKIYRVLLLVVTAGLVFGALVLPIALRPSSAPVELGDVAPQTYTAPSALTYESEVLTAAAKQSASNTISNQYLSADYSILREQSNKLQNLLDTITIIRENPSPSFDFRKSLLKSIKDFALSDKAAETILLLTDAQWDLISQESISALERTMRKTIRDYQVQDNVNNLPSLISYSVPREQVFIVEELTSPFIVANSLYSAEKTDAAKQQAMDVISPVTRTYVQNQTIAFKGQIITEEQLEALQVFGLIKPTNKVQDLIAAGSIVATLVCFIFFIFFLAAKFNPWEILKV